MGHMVHLPGATESLFPLLGIIIAAISIGVALYYAITQRSKSLHTTCAPVISVDAICISKHTVTRADEHHVMHDTLRDTRNNISTTMYSITFEEQKTGQRHTFTVNRPTFNMIMEHDRGTLIFQGMQFHHFNRIAHPHG